MMETKVMMPSPAPDLHFDSATTSPYMTAPSSPQRPAFGGFFLFSAPTSPTRASAFYGDLNDFRTDGGGLGIEDADGGGPGSPSAIPFDWEEKPGTPKANRAIDDGDFAFDFSGQITDGSSLSADELFAGGKIKPLKPPPRLQYPEGSKSAFTESPRSPRSPTKVIKEALSPHRRRRKEFDPFAAAFEQTRNGNADNWFPDQRGRERKHNSLNNSSTKHKGTSRSLSPFRVSDLLIERENNKRDAKDSSASSSAGSFSFSNWYRKWRLRDILLFRSASEGRAGEAANLKKYSAMRKTMAEEAEEAKNSSFRSMESVESSSSSSSGRRRSAHEMHYAAKRAAAEEMRRRTYLPYKRGLLGCLGFNPSINADLSKGFNSISRS